MSPTPASSRTTDLIRALAASHRDGIPLDAAAWTDAVLDETGAYAVHDGVARALGWPATRWKSGGAGPQGPFSHSPVSPEHGSVLLGVEAEVALRLARDIRPDEAQAPLDARVIDGMCIAVECIASRWRQALDAPALLRMADFQSNAGLLLGPWQAWQPLAWAHLPWRLSLSGEPAVQRQGGHSLGDPSGVLAAWLRHATRHGETVRAGTVVTTGAWGGVHRCAGRATGTLAIDGLGAFSFSAGA